MTPLGFVLWEAGFLRQIARAGGPRLTRSDLGAARGRYADRVVPGRSRRVRFMTHMAGSLLAASELLEGAHRLPRAEATAILRRAFLANGRGLTRALTRTWLASRRDPMAALTRHTPAARARALWGDGLTTEEEVTNDRATLRVTGCGFADYFWSAGRSDLTPILCAYDIAWLEDINSGGRPIRAWRDGTLAEGRGACTFVFTRSETPESDAGDPALPRSERRAS